MKRGVKLAADLDFPVEIVTQTIAVLAKRRAGKSYTMRRLVEQLHGAGQQVVLVDPKGDQWGIRSAADGKGPGLPFVLLGGERWDVPLEAGAGEVVAKLVVEERVSVVLDLSLFRKHELATFMTAFMENLYRLKAREQFRTPLMLVIDEADVVAPQKPQKGEERMLGAAEDLVRRGGQRGIGCVLVSQRSAVLNKNVLTQAQMLIVLRTIAPQDLAAMKAWIEVHGDDAQGRELMASLPSLPVGDAWIWSPGWPKADGIFERVHVLPIETFDSGATPKPGEQRREPKHLADVDLDALKRQMAATIERAKADDPRELKKQIAELRRERHKLSRAAQIVPTGTKAATEVRETPVLTDADRALLRAVHDRLGAMAGELGAEAGAFLAGVEARAEQIVAAAMKDFEKKVMGAHDVRRREFEQLLEKKGFRKILDKLSALPAPITHHPTTTTKSPGGRETPRAVSTRPAVRAPDGEHRVGAAEQRILDALAWWRAAGIEEPTRHQVAFVAGYTVNGHFNNSVGALRTKGLVDYPTGGGVSLTEAGAAASGPVDEVPTRAALVEKVLAVLRSEPARRVFQAVVDAGGDLTREELATRAGYTVNGHFNNIVGSLHSLGVVDYPSRGGVTLGRLFEALS